MVEQDLNLTLAATKNINRSHPGHRLQGLLDLVLGDFGQFFQAPEAGHRNRRNRRGVNIELLHNRRVGVFGQVGQNRADFVPHFLGRNAEIFFQHKLDHHLRQSLTGHRAQLVDSR